MRKTIVISSIVFLLSSFTVIIHSAAPPQGYTGAQGVYCNDCHSTNALNNPGGSVSAVGLPDGSYTAGTTYNFSITISHSAVNRRRFGFSIIAVNSAGQQVGTFSSSNPNAAVNGDELSHLNAPSLSVNTQSYTYSNLKWTAPANPALADQSITFYIAGNAANGSGSSGDFIYSNVVMADLLSVQTYTFTGNGNWSEPANWANNTVPPSTINGNANIVIDPLADGECVLDIPQTIGAGATLEVKAGKRFVINGNLTMQ